MKYDFETIIDRQGLDAIAFDAVGNGGPGAPKPGFDVIPMWIADMNFATVPTIPEAIIKRAKHPVYGYFEESEEYYNAIINWQKDRFGSEVTKENIGYENGVLGGVVAALNVFCSKGDKVLLHSPTYIGFTGALTKNGYQIIHSPLVKDENNIWRMDFADMEEMISKHHIHACVFCSPHNPCGRVFERWELEKAMEIFQRHDVKIVSDEIWSDLVLEGKHLPLQSINEYARKNTVALYAPSKTFNLAGLVGSYHIAYDQWLIDRMKKESNLPSYNEMNVLSMHALIGAYSKEGREWLEELLEVLRGNVDYAINYIKEHFAGVKVARPQGTYMIFVDFEDWCKAHNKTMDELLKAFYDVGCAVNDGRRFHGAYAIRMNLASPLSRIKEAFRRLDLYVINKQD